MENITVQFAANITYNGITENTRLTVEYKHTGKQWFYKVGRREHYTESAEIAKEKKEQGVKITEKPGYFFIDRLAIPTINAKGEPDIWYINNPEDFYTINKVSKYAKKIHKLLSENIIPNNLATN